MKIAVVGATGYVGARIVEEAAKRGHDVIGICRHIPEGTAPEHVHYVTADVSNVDQLKEAMKGAEVVIHAFAPPKSNPLQQNIDIIEPGTRNIVEAAIAVHAKRLIAVGGAGTLNYKGMKFMDHPDFPPQYMNTAKFTEKVSLIVLPEKRIPCTVFCPAGNLFLGERTGHYRLSEDDLVVDKKGESNISTHDYAVAMIDEVENKKYIGKRFTAAY